MVLFLLYHSSSLVIVTVMLRQKKYARLWPFLILTVATMQAMPSQSPSILFHMYIIYHLPISILNLSQSLQHY